LASWRLPYSEPEILANRRDQILKLKFGRDEMFSEVGCLETKDVISQRGWKPHPQAVRLLTAHLEWFTAHANPTKNFSIFKVPRKF
jgi:hypothetical protein